MRRLENIWNFYFLEKTVYFFFEWNTKNETQFLVSVQVWAIAMLE